MNWNDNVNTQDGHKVKLADFIKSASGASDLVGNISTFNQTVTLEEQTDEVVFYLDLIDQDLASGGFLMFSFWGELTDDIKSSGSCIVSYVYDGADFEYDISAISTSNASNPDVFYNNGEISIHLYEFDDNNFKAGPVTISGAAIKNRR